MSQKRPDDFDASSDVDTIVVPRLSFPSGLTFSFVVTVVDGPDAGRVFRINPSEPSRVLVGQSPSCAMRLTDPQVSRRHIALEVEESQLRLTDVGSTNGTKVNGMPVVEVLLRGGERLEIGKSVLQVECATDAGFAEPPVTARFGKLIGASPEMRRLYPLCDRLAASAVPVIIEGETGTGKEVLAESLHELGPRASGPFVVFDCTAVPPNLMEAALFGHERGSFTGATEMRKGVFEQAHGGTLLIDEIGDLELPLQAKLLRALERSEIRRIGGNRFMRVDVRVLAATRRDLDVEVQQGRFRDDLFFRLAVARIELPPLRKRQGDIEVLTRAFWRFMAGSGAPVPDDFLRRLENYGWPGNVRELYNSVARRVALGELAEDDVMDTVGLRRTIRPAASPASDTQDKVDSILAEELPLTAARDKLVEYFERRYIERLLLRNSGNVGKAAEEAGVARRYFQLLRAKRHVGDVG
ncbi:MAG: sigma 54-interacting transcriptional regulator [Polyangiaceae bacterium]|jgi:DNA-binding NtrC family response regulator|nr:sigma 54-interacting transcriptional regulator [Polyangiaceae bacterium]